MGIKSPNYTPFPNELLDEWLGILTPPEWCVLSYLVRHTFGYHKNVECLTYQHFLVGVMRADGSPVDRGCGIKSYTTIHNALVHLQEVGLIEIIHGHRPNGAEGRSSYRLCIDEEAGRALVAVRPGITAPVKPDDGGITAPVKPALQLLKSQGITEAVEPIKDRKENPKENPTEKKTVCGAAGPRRARAAITMVTTDDEPSACMERRLALKLAGDVLACQTVSCKRLEALEAFCRGLLEQGYTCGELSRWMNWMNSGSCFWHGKSFRWSEQAMVGDLESWESQGRPPSKED